MSTSTSSSPSSSRASTRTPRARSQRCQPGAWYSVTTTVGIEAARRGRLGDAHDGGAVCGHPHARLALLAELPRLLEGAADDVAELDVDLVLLPEVLLQPLDPFEVGDDDASGVREHVREDQDAHV